MEVTIKFVQKISLKDFKLVEEFLRTEGINVLVPVGEPSSEGVQAIKYVGVVTRIFNLGRKLEVKIRFKGWPVELKNPKLVQTTQGANCKKIWVLQATT